MNSPDSLSREELIAVILEQQKLIGELRRQIEELRRGGKRQAAPFSKGTRLENPKAPGRKPDEGPFRRRGEPQPAPSETVLAVTPPLCPDCGGDLVEEGRETVTTTHLPHPAPRVKAWQVPLCRCRRCGARVRGTAPDLPAGQRGATAHRIGEDVMAAAHLLHYGVGIPVRKVPAVLKQLAGVGLTQSALTQDALRRAAGAAGRLCEGLRRSVQDSAAVYTDDTGWRVGGENAFLMAFDTDHATVYQIRDRHRNEEVREVIPADYAGVMVSDRGRSYDAGELAGVGQQKCLSHLLRNVSEAVAVKSGRARQFGVNLLALLREGLALWKARSGLSEAGFRERRLDLESRLTRQLHDRVLRDDDNQRLLNGIGAQHDRGNILRFLERPGVEPTNNRAERALRPAVIARKVSQCSKNRRGAYASEVFLSLIQTARKKCGEELSEVLPAMLSSPASAPAR